MISYLQGKMQITNILKLTSQENMYLNL